MPIFYECERCAACCRWPGQVNLTEDEITRLAAFLGLDEIAFIQRFTRLKASRTGLALQDQPDGSCIFFNAGDCEVNAVKPQQCRDFPNLWSFPNFEQVCRAVPKQVTLEEWRERVRRATGREIQPGSPSPDRSPDAVVKIGLDDPSELL